MRSIPAEFCYSITLLRSATPQPETGEVVITYIYDPLYRLTSADYSTGEFYHYTYDLVGNRLTEETQLATKNYIYDNANRLASVGGVNYTFDANGNLLNDGANAYTYDSANRLISVNATDSYSYNGLGDRLTQNGIQYTLDLNTGLTQVLDDGTNTYLYGNGRVAQTGSSTEYFLGDALGSVRQLTAGDGNITLAKSYDPYGNVIQSTGSGASPFAFTGEQADPNGLVYLCARYYGPGDGRFLSRDTWAGDINSPLSFNRWNYVEGNPINGTDPSGNAPSSYCITDDDRVATAKFYVTKYGFDEMNIYIAAGIAVQCPGQLIDKFADENDGVGIAQVSEKQAQTPWGVLVKDENGGVHGYGLLCYMVSKLINGEHDCPIRVCAEEAEIAKAYPGAKYKQEDPLDPHNPYHAVELMRRRIEPVVNRCNKNMNCSSTDKFIAAGFAQNRPGFTVENLEHIQNNYMNQGRIDWTAFLLGQKKRGNLQYNLDNFRRLALILKKDGYYLPSDYDDWAVVKAIIAGVR